MNENTTGIEAQGLTAEEVKYLDGYAAQVRFFKLCYADLLRRARVELARELMLRRMPGVRC